MVLPKKQSYKQWENCFNKEIVAPDATITARCFMDISIGDSAPERLVLGLYGNAVPKTAENFKVAFTIFIFNSTLGVM